MTNEVESTIHGRKILFEKAVSLGGYPAYIKVKETGWESAVDSCCFFLSMGKDERAWTWSNRRCLENLIEALQEALKYAKDPGMQEALEYDKFPEDDKGHADDLPEQGS